MRRTIHPLRLGGERRGEEIAAQRAKERPGDSCPALPRRRLQISVTSAPMFFSSVIARAARTSACRRLRTTRKIIGTLSPPTFSSCAIASLASSPGTRLRGGLLGQLYGDALEYHTCLRPSRRAPGILSSSW